MGVLSVGAMIVRMDLGSLLASLFCFAVSLVLLLTAAWSRWGSSKVARWWVRRTPVERMGFMQSSGEAVGLGLVPYLAQLMACVGVVAALYAHPRVREALFTPVMWTVVVAEVVLGIVVMVMVSNRYILPLFFYPGWLRHQRRAERDWLRTR
ncbi:hypothetical protein [Brachybacterium sacelli]|uniref:Uncharacterized protein n=1 Tax=Brachybacterium sacelli TaxID=173364 RepID=A0ABS4X5S2_9MICO|nr:hypothetical protein [Brachybacterium sacelli]MBP2383064.1 hypothetical protein [Brachybacterium sacelli]